MSDSPAWGNVSGPASWQLTPADRARWELLCDPARADRWIAYAARVSIPTVRRIRAELESSGELEPVITRRQRSAAQRTTDRELAAMTGWSRVPAPDLAAGICATHEQPDLWTSEDLEERRLAAGLCRGCVVLSECAAWALTVPISDRHTVLAGMTPWQQRQQRDRVKASPHPDSCPHDGTDLTDPANVYTFPGGARQCRECRRRYDRERRARAQRRLAAVPGPRGRVHRTGRRGKVA